MAKLITIDENYIYEYRTFFLNETGGSSEQVSSSLQAKMLEYGRDGWQFHSSIRINDTQFHLIFERKTSDRPVAFDRTKFEED